VAGAAAVEAGAAALEAARVPLRELMDDRLLDALLERSRDEAGGLRLTGAGSMLGELIAAVLERALAAVIMLGPCDASQALAIGGLGSPTLRF